MWTKMLWFAVDFDCLGRRCVFWYLNKQAKFVFLLQNPCHSTNLSRNNYLRICALISAEGVLHFDFYKKIVLVDRLVYSVLQLLSTNCCSLFFLWRKKGRKIVCLSHFTIVYSGHSFRWLKHSWAPSRATLIWHICQHWWPNNCVMCIC